MPLGTEVDLSPGHNVLNGAQLPSGKGDSSPPLFSAHVYGQTVAHLSYCWALVLFYAMWQWNVVCKICVFICDSDGQVLSTKLIEATVTVT